MLKFKINPLIKQYIMVVTLNLSLLNAALSLAWASPVLVKLMNEDTTPLSRVLTVDEGSWVVSSLFLGTIFSLLVPFVTNRIGRKYSILLASVPQFIAGLLYIFASNVWMILVGRLLCGAAGTLVFSNAPAYAAEIASTKIRGALGTTMQISFSLGSLVMMAVGPYVSYFTIHLIFILCIVINTIPILFVPDSPYFLYTKGRHEESLKILISIRESKELAYEEIETYAQIHDKVKVDKNTVCSKTFMKATVIVILLNLITQLTGLNCIAPYAQTIFESTQTSLSPELGSTFLGIIGMLAPLVTSLTTDRFGRKPLLCVMSLGICVGMIGMGAFFKIKENDEQISGFMNYVPLISLILVTFCSSAGICSVFFGLVVELYDGPSRTLGITIANVNLDLSTFALSKTFPLLLSSLGPSVTYWFFSLVCILKILFVIFFLPETKGKKFSEIQEELATCNFKCGLKKEIVAS